MKFVCTDLLLLARPDGKLTLFSESISKKVESSAALKDALPPVLCRPIISHELDEVVTLLCEGFPTRSPSYWRKGFDNLERINQGINPGNTLECNGELVGVLLGLRDPGSPGDNDRCHLSSWYVKPAFRAAAMMLERRLTANPSTTYVSASPALHTLKLIRLLRYEPYNADSLVCLPWLSLGRNVRVESYVPAQHDHLFQDHATARMAGDHLAFGCIVCVALTKDGPRLFVFARRRQLPLGMDVVQLVYAASHEDLEAFTGPVGCFLLLRRVGLWMVDADERINGVPGFLFSNRARRWAKRPNPPRRHDLSYSELAIFGF